MDKKANRFFFGIISLGIIIPLLIILSLINSLCESGKLKLICKGCSILPIHIIPLIFGLLLLFGIIKGILNSVISIKKLSYFKNRLRLVKSNNYRYPIKIFINEGITPAFSMGFFKPQIYISKSFYNTLNKKELRSVISHEIHHIKNNDIIKSFIISFIKDFIFFIPLVDILIDKFHEFKEKAADDYAINNGNNIFDLSNAILKVLNFNAKSLPIPIYFKGNISPKARIERLMGLDNNKSLNVPLLKGLVSIFTVIILSFNLSYYLTLSKSNNIHIIDSKKEILCCNNYK